MSFPIVQFFVAGIPKPAGSKRGFYIAKIKRVVITDDCKTSRDWKTDVKHEAQRQYDGPLWTCPIRLELTFIMPRPASHYRTGKNAHMLRDSAPERPTSKPDVLKLARGVEDALTKIIWEDDAQIVDEELNKFYIVKGSGFHGRPGCHIFIKPILSTVPKPQNTEAAELL